MNHCVSPSECRLRKNLIGYHKLFELCIPRASFSALKINLTKRMWYWLIGLIFCFDTSQSQFHICFEVLPIHLQKRRKSNLIISRHKPWTNYSQWLWLWVEDVAMLLRKSNKIILKSFHSVTRCLEQTDIVTISEFLVILIGTVDDFMIIAGMKIRNFKKIRNFLICN